MGVDVKQLAKMMESGQIDKRKLAELGPDYMEMLDIFKQLASIKQKLEIFFLSTKLIY